MIPSLRQNKVAKNAVLNTSAFLAPAFFMLVFTPLLLHKMGSEAYGLWSIALSILGVAGVFELGLGTALSKYIAESNHPNTVEALSSYATMGFVINLVLAVAFFVPVYYLAPVLGRYFPTESLSSADVGAAIRYSAFGFVPMLVRNASLAVPIGFQEFLPPTVVRISQSILVVVAAYLATTIGLSTSGVILSSVLVMWLSAAASFLIAARILNKSQVRLSWSPSHGVLLMKYMFYSGATGVGIALFSSLDRILVGLVLGMSGVAFYSIAVGAANKLIGLASALTQALMPASSQWKEEGDLHSVQRYLWGTTFLLLVANAFLVGILLLFSNPLLVFWLGKSSAPSVLPIFRILVLIYGVMSISAPSFHIANGIGKPWINSAGTLVQGLGIVVLIPILGSRFGLIGAAWANVSSWAKFASLPYSAAVVRRGIAESQVHETV